jgi:hypothetical protein
VVERICLLIRHSRCSTVEPTSARARVNLGRAQTIRHRAERPSLGTPPLGISTSTPPPTVVKSVGDAPKPALDTPAGDVMRRTLIGTTVESAVQNAAAATTARRRRAPSTRSTSAPTAKG